MLQCCRDHCVRSLLIWAPSPHLGPSEPNRCCPRFFFLWILSFSSSSAFSWTLTFSSSPPLYCRIHQNHIHKTHLIHQTQKGNHPLISMIRSKVTHSWNLIWMQLIELLVFPCFLPRFLPRCPPHSLQLVLPHFQWCWSPTRDTVLLPVPSGFQLSHLLHCLVVV